MIPTKLVDSIAGTGFGPDFAPSAWGGVFVDWLLVLGGLGVGTVVGLTGMGGGALMTPMLVIFFGVDPVTAVSEDLMVSLVLKPFGAAMHAGEGNGNHR